ncbi:uncharacterized protein [Macrobrachium rosenbergii]|uniref:uncharacterized protein n=1 Tax=Macrobrachium rosenbergii TaxID=79674 RepID=UPI0034D77FBE
MYSETVEIHTQLVNYVLEKTTSEGRLIMPLLWNPRVSHLLGHNFNISEKILSSLQRKLQGNLDYKLKQINMVFKEQADAGIIERIENLDQFKTEHPESSFMPFMGIFKPDRETTKCRVVFLSNLSDKGSMNHNQTMHAGPTLNQKLSTSIINLRVIEDTFQHMKTNVGFQNSIAKVKNLDKLLTWNLFSQQKDPHARILTLQSV